MLDPRGLLDVIACFVEKKVDGTFLEENDLLQVGKFTVECKWLSHSTHNMHKERCPLKPSYSIA